MITEVDFATLDNITLSGTPTLRGFATSVGQTVLAAGQTSGAQNGIYTVASGAWSRHTDHDTSAEFVRPWVIFVRSGFYANWRFQYTGPDSPTLNTSILHFEVYARDTAEGPGAGIEITEDGNFISLLQRGVYGNWSVGPLDFSTNDMGLITGISAGYGQEVYIEGFIPSWVSGGNPIFTAGAAWVPGMSRVLEVPIDQNGPVGVLPSGGFVYFYLQPSSGDPNVAGFTTAPDTPYSGTARKKTGDANSRYIIALRTNAAGTAFYNFYAQMLSDKRLFIRYKEDHNASPFRVLTSGTATTYTTVSCSSVVPPTSQMAYVRFSNNSDQQARISLPGESTNYTTVTLRSGAGLPGVDETFLLLNSSQQFSYKLDAAPSSSGLYVDVLGYIDVR